MGPQKFLRGTIFLEHHQGRLSCDVREDRKILWKDDMQKTFELNDMGSTFINEVEISARKIAQIKYEPDGEFGSSQIWRQTKFGNTNGIQTVIFYFSDTSIFDRMSDERVDDRDIETLFTEVAEERNVINSGGFQKDVSFLEFELFCFFNGKNSSIQRIRIFVENLERLPYEVMVTIGLGYLSLNRETATLSGGESQRIKMVRQLGNSLTDLTYIFDEPSIGLHPYDISKINTLMKLLRDKGNTVLIVEHDPDIIKIADHIVDMGPGAGTQGGQILYEGDLKGLEEANTLTGRYLSYQPKLKQSVRMPKGWLSIQNAKLHNLKNISVEIPKGVLTVVTGVAGSGKSTLINQVLPQFYPEIIFIDQNGVPASKRSNIATCTGIFNIIRKLFATQNGVNASLFSFNSKGACPACKGLGVTYTDLAFMDAIVTVCEECNGNRFNDEVLQYKLRGKNISEILKMTVGEALNFFYEKAISKVIKRLSDIGINYISLGQPLNTLSGGELQRIKLASELENDGQIYVLDEPSTGMHMADIKQLIGVLEQLVEQNSTLIVIEHNLTVICQADWIIDLGPNAGGNGGRIMFSGLPKDLIKNHESLTGRCLAQYVKEECKCPQKN